MYQHQNKIGHKIDLDNVKLFTLIIRNTGYSSNITRDIQKYLKPKNKTDKFKYFYNFICILKRRSYLKIIYPQKIKTP